MKSNGPDGWRWWLWPLRSRKVQVAVTTLIVAWGGHAGWALDAELVATIVAVGVSIILGIAIEDAGEKSRPGSATDWFKLGDFNGKP